MSDLTGKWCINCDHEWDLVTGKPCECAEVLEQKVYKNGVRLIWRNAKGHITKELSYNRVRPNRYVYHCSKCDEYLDAGYHGGALKIASCKCMEVTA